MAYKKAVLTGLKLQVNDKNKIVRDKIGADTPIPNKLICKIC